MSSKAGTTIRNTVGIIFFLQLAVVLVLFLNTASVEVDEAYSVYGTANVAAGSSAWLHLENSNLGSGQLEDPSNVTISSESLLERNTNRTPIGPIDIIEVRDLQSSTEIEFSREISVGDPLSAAVSIGVAPPQDLGAFWDGESMFRSFSSVVTGYEDEGVHWKREPVSPHAPGLQLHVAVAGGTMQALMDNDVYFLVTDEVGGPLQGVAVALTRSSLDGEAVVERRTNRLGLASATIQPRYTEDWSITVNEVVESETTQGAPVWQAHVVPARDGIIVEPRGTPFVSETTVPVDIQLQGTRGTAFVLTHCTDQTYGYAIGGLPGGDSVAEINVPPSVIDGPRICRVQISTATGYQSAARSLSAYVATGQVAPRTEALIVELLNVAGRTFAPTQLSTISSDAWLQRLTLATEMEREALTRFLLATAPIAYEPLTELYSSRADIETAVDNIRSSRLFGLRWLLLGELIAGIALILAFVIPAQRRSARAFAELDDGDDEAFGDMSATRGSVLIFWGLMILVMSTVVAGFIFLFSIID